METETRWPPFCIHLQIHLFSNEMHKFRLKFIAICSYKGAAYKSKLVQSMAWRRADSKQLTESVAIQVNGAYMHLSDSLIWLLNRTGKLYRWHAGKNDTVKAHEGYLHPHSWKWVILNHQVGSSRGTGWSYFVKSPLSKEVGAVYCRIPHKYFNIQGRLE